MRLKTKCVADRYYIVGQDAFYAKDVLKAAGARWDRKEKAWYFPSPQIAKSLVDSLRSVPIVKNADTASKFCGRCGEVKPVEAGPICAACNDDMNSPRWAAVKRPVEFEVDGEERG
jgi:hypothetical protein